MYTLTNQGVNGPGEEEILLKRYPEDAKVTHPKEDQEMRHVASPQRYTVSGSWLCLLTPVVNCVY